MEGIWDHLKVKFIKTVAVFDLLPQSRLVALLIILLISIPNFVSSQSISSSISELSGASSLTLLMKSVED